MKGKLRTMYYFCSSLSYLKEGLSSIQFGYKIRTKFIRIKHNGIKMKLFHWIIFVIPILLIGIVFLNKILFGINDPFYRDLSSEDNLIENLTVYAYFLAFGFSLFILKYIKKNTGVFSIFLILSIIFLVGGLEEISYGQRILGFNNLMFSSNTQGEITIHNLDLVQPYRHFYYIIISFLGSFSWLIFPKIKFFSNELFIKYALPPKFLFSYFSSVLIIVSVMKYVPVEFINGNVTFGFFINYDSEFFELILALGLMLYVINSFYQIRKRTIKEI